MNLFLNSINNRDIALVFWLIVIFFGLFFLKNIRELLPGLLKTFISKQILIPIFLMLLYISLTVIFLSKISLWNISVIKDTVYWTLGIAFIMLLNSNNAIEKEHFFRDVLKENLKLIVMLEFIVNLYVFNLAIELILMPTITLIVMLSFVAGANEEHVQVKKFLDYVMGIIGLYFICYALYKIVIGFQDFTTLNNLLSFILAPILTVAFLPFIYFIAIYMGYQTLFINLRLFKKKKEFIKYAKINIFILCRFNLNKLKRFSKQIKAISIKDKNDLLIAIQRFKEKPDM